MLNVGINSPTTAILMTKAIKHATKFMNQHKATAG